MDTILTGIIISGLVVSTGPVSDAAIAAYEDWGANHVTVWQADEASYWRNIPTTVWVDENGCGLTWQRTPNCQWDDERAVRTGNDSSRDETIRQQIGDEPATPDHVYPVGDNAYTNFSFWAPLAHGGVPELELPSIIDAYNGDHLTTSEYLIRGNDRNVHWWVIDFMREQASDRSFGVYLNAYAGYETNFEMDHTQAELREHAYGALAFGATEFIWFTYAFGPNGHEEARQGGGSIITVDGTWEQREAWQMTKGINHGLARLSTLLGDYTSTTWNDELITGVFGSDILYVARTDVSVPVIGWVTGSNGISRWVQDESIVMHAGDVSFVSETTRGDLVIS